MVDVGYRMNAQRKLTTQRLSLTWYIQTVIYRGISWLSDQRKTELTIATLALDVHMEILIALQRVFQELNLLVTLDALRFRIGLALAITFQLIQAHHLVDTVLVLLLDAELELELRQHELDARPQMRGVILDEICIV